VLRVAGCATGPLLGIGCVPRGRPGLRGRARASGKRCWRRRARGGTGSCWCCCGSAGCAWARPRASPVRSALRRLLDGGGLSGAGAASACRAS
jgi:hypothetical protein